MVKDIQLASSDERVHDEFEKVTSFFIGDAPLL